MFTDDTNASHIMPQKDVQIVDSYSQPSSSSIVFYAPVGL